MTSPTQLLAKIVRDLAGCDPTAPSHADEVICVLCGAEGPPGTPGDDFQHELSCPWLRAQVTCGFPEMDQPEDWERQARTAALQERNV